MLALRRLRQALRRAELAAGGGRASGPLLVEARRRARRTWSPSSAAASRPAVTVARLLSAARAAVATPGATAEDVLWAVWQRTGLATRWERASRAGGPAGEAADRDLDAVVALFDAAARFVDRLPGAGPEVFLDHLLGQQIPGDTRGRAGAADDAVRLLTAHAAKGLEWDLVCVAGVQEGVWPDLRLRGSLLGSERLVDLLRPGRADGCRWWRRRPPSAAARRGAPAVLRRRDPGPPAAARHRGDQRARGASPSRFLDELDPPADRRRRGR